jgi:hypothetical protein
LVQSEGKEGPRQTVRERVRNELAAALSGKRPFSDNARKILEIVSIDISYAIEQIETSSVARKNRVVCIVDLPKK